MPAAIVLDAYKESEKSALVNAVGRAPPMAGHSILNQGKRNHFTLPLI
jgi:hypothetical protein